MAGEEEKEEEEDAGIAGASPRVVSASAAEAGVQYPQPVFSPEGGREGGGRREGGREGEGRVRDCIRDKQKTPC